MGFGRVAAAITAPPPPPPSGSSMCSPRSWLCPHNVCSSTLHHAGLDSRLPALAYTRALQSFFTAVLCLPRVC
jgi:hypothetical protein